MTQFNQTSFQSALDSGGLVLVDFWAEWCSHCQPLGPVMEALAEKYEGRAVIGKLNVDEERALAMQYGVMGIPTVILFQEGKEVDRKVGAHPIEIYDRALEERLKD